MLADHREGGLIHKTVDSFQIWGEDGEDDEERVYHMLIHLKNL